MRGRLLVACLALLVAARAHAAGRERVAIAVFNVTGEPIAEEQRAKLRANLRGGLAGFEVVPDDEVERAVRERGIVGCDTITCLRSLGDAVMVRRVVKATIEVIGSSNFSTRLELIDLGEGRPVATAKDDCTTCRMQEVYDGVSNAAAQLKMQLEPQPGAPPPLGAPPPPPQDTTPNHRGLYIGLAAGSGALFLASVITLAVSGAYHGKTTCDSSFPTGERCPTRYNGTPGIVLGAIGTPLFGAATAIFAWRAAKQPTHVALVPTVGVGTAALDLHVAW